MLAPVIIVAIVSLGTALLGNHVGAALDAMGELRIDALAECLQAALRGGASSLVASPLPLSSGDAALMCSLLGFAAPWVPLMFWLTRGRASDRAGEQHGSARWALRRDLEAFATAGNPDPENVLLLSEHYGLAISRRDYDRVHDKNLNVTVIGGSGSGKTRYFVKPNLAQCSMNIVATDPKGTLLPEVGQMLVDEGYEIVSFDTNVYSRSLRFNPFDYLHTDLEILEWVDGFMAMTRDEQRTGGDQFWDDTTRLLLVALIAFLRDWCPASDRNFGGLLELLSRAEAREDDETYESGLDLLFKEIETGYETSVAAPTVDSRRREVAPSRPSDVGRVPSRRVNNTDRTKRPGDLRLRAGRWVRGLTPTEDFALSNYKAFKTAAGKTLKSILITTNSKLRAIRTRQVLDLLCGPDELHLERLCEPGRKVALFDTFKDTNQATLGFLHGLLIWQVITLCCKVADEGTGRLERPVQLFLDEFKSLSLPKSLADMISVVRSRNIGICIIVQSLEQLYQLYDEHCANGIIGCCDTLLYLGGGDLATNKQVSETIGQQTLEQRNLSVSHTGLMGGSWSTQDQTLGRALIDPAEVGKVPGGECLVIVKGTEPARDRSYPLERHRRYPLMDPGHKAVWEWRSPVYLKGEGTRRPAVRFPLHRVPSVYKEKFDLLAHYGRAGRRRARQSGGRGVRPAGGSPP